MNITKEQNEVVNEIVDIIGQNLGDEERNVDTIEAISTCARLSGSLLFRSFNYQMKDVKPGSAILSEEANNKGPILINITYAVLQSLRIEIDNSKMSDNFNVEPKLNFIESINLVQNQALEIMNKYKLSFEQLSHSAAMATAFIIKQSQNIQPETAFSIAIYYYIEGSKTYPPEFINSTINTTVVNSIESNRKPWWKIW